MSWEYKIIFYGEDWSREDRVAFLNKHGEESWELVDVRHPKLFEQTIYTFKRRTNWWLKIWRKPWKSLNLK